MDTGIRTPLGKQFQAWNGVFSQNCKGQWLLTTCLDTLAHASVHITQNQIKSLLQLINAFNEHTCRLLLKLLYKSSILHSP